MAFKKTAGIVEGDKSMILYLSFLIICLNTCHRGNMVFVKIRVNSKRSKNLRGGGGESKSTTMVRFYLGKDHWVMAFRDQQHLQSS